MTMTVTMTMTITVNVLTEKGPGELPGPCVGSCGGGGLGGCETRVLSGVSCASPLYSLSSHRLTSWILSLLLNSLQGQNLTLERHMRPGAEGRGRGVAYVLHLWAEGKLETKKFSESNCTFT